jgi:hypothetical protein
MSLDTFIIPQLSLCFFAIAACPWSTYPVIRVVHRASGVSELGGWRAHFLNRRRSMQKGAHSLNQTFAAKFVTNKLIRPGTRDMAEGRGKEGPFMEPTFGNSAPAPVSI